MAAKRDYKEEYKYHQTDAQKKRRAARNKARRTALAKGKVKKGDKKEDFEGMMEQEPLMGQARFLANEEMLWDTSISIK